MSRQPFEKAEELIQITPSYSDEKCADFLCYSEKVLTDLFWLCLISDKVCNRLTIFRYYMRNPWILYYFLSKAADNTNRYLYTTQGWEAVAHLAPLEDHV